MSAGFIIAASVALAGMMLAAATRPGFMRWLFPLWFGGMTAAVLTAIFHAEAVIEHSGTSFVVAVVLLILSVVVSIGSAPKNPERRG